MHKVEINHAACAGCGICVETCPTDVLRMDKQMRAFAAYESDCQGCFICQWDCALEAIRVRIQPSQEKLA